MEADLTGLKQVSDAELHSIKTVSTYYVTRSSLTLKTFRFILCWREHCLKVQNVVGTKSGDVTVVVSRGNHNRWQLHHVRGAAKNLHLSVR